MTFRKRFLKPLAIGVTIVVVAGSIVGLRATQAKKEDKKDDTVVLEFAPADVAVVEMRELVRSIPVSGSLAPVIQTTVKSKVAGDMNKVTVRDGERVAAGQVLAQVDTVELQYRYDMQNGVMEEAKARLSIAEKNRENNLALLHQKFISQNAYDTTQSTFEGAIASAKSAEAQLRMAKKALDDSVIRSPFSGFIAKKIVNPGEKVAIDSPLFSIIDLTQMEIEAAAPASEVPSVKIGQPARFRVDGFGARVFEGRVARINPTSDTNSRSIIIYISVGNTDEALRGGMFAKGEIVVDKSAPAMVVPATAVREEAGQTYVFAIEKGKVTRRNVKVGASEPQAGLVEVKSGVEKGLAVVSARVAGLKPGSPAIMKGPAEAPKAG